MKNFNYGVRDKFSQLIVITPFKPERYYSSNKPKQCPKCKSVLIAQLLYGESNYSAELHADLKAGRIILAGSMLADAPNPQWKCLDCETEIYQKES